MKKRTLKSLRLNKKSISNLDNNVLGGRPPASRHLTDCNNSICPSVANECNLETFAHTGCPSISDC